MFIFDLSDLKHMIVIRTSTTAFQMQIPATSCYKDVNTDMKMAPFDRENVNAYMERFGVEFDQVVTSLYGDKFLLYLRMFSSEKLCYVKSSCRAEMKNNLIMSLTLHSPNMALCMRHSVNVVLVKVRSDIVNMKGLFCMRV